MGEKRRGGAFPVDVWAHVVAALPQGGGRFAVRLVCRAAKCGEEAEVLRRLVSRCSARPADGGAPPGGLARRKEAADAAVDAGACPVRVARALVGRCATPGNAVVWAASRDLVAVLDWLAARAFAPCCAHTGTVRMALVVAAASGHAAALGRLAQPPYSATHRDAVEAGLLGAAAWRGHADVVRRLGRPPFSLGRADALGQSPAPAWCGGTESALAFALELCHAGVLDELGRPPFDVRGDDVRAAGGLVLVVDAPAPQVAPGAERVLATLDRLAEPPFSLGQEDARRCADAGVVPRDAAVRERLARPPYAP